jgi:hypothetical protein
MTTDTHKDAHKDTHKDAAVVVKRDKEAAAEGPVVTVPKGMEPPPSMVSTTAPPLGAEVQHAQPWTTKTPLPDQGGHAEKKETAKA